MDDFTVEPPVTKPTGKAVYDSYDEWVRHFVENPKTTDECWTPRDIYEAVVQYVGEIYDMTGKQIIRPFYPGGDYENCEYPDNGVVIDNPPFSIVSKIVTFYSARNIKFFLFCPGLTARFYDFATLVVTGYNIVYENGANVMTAFYTNITPGVTAIASCRLTSLLESCPSQNVTKNLPKWEYPQEICRISELNTIGGGGRGLLYHAWRMRGIEDAA